jgi:hypothetical protein
MSSLGTIKLSGKDLNGRVTGPYEFNIYHRETEFKAIGAVYVQSKVGANDRYQIIYIGQTGDLSVRPLNHHKTNCFDKRGADKLLIHSESSEKERFRIEAELIRNYNPPCNDQ